MDNQRMPLKHVPFLVRVPVKPYAEISERLRRLEGEVHGLMRLGQQKEALDCIDAVLKRELPSHPYLAVSRELESFRAFVKHWNPRDPKPLLKRAYLEDRHPTYAQSLHFEPGGLVPSKIRQWWQAKHRLETPGELAAAKQA